MIARHPGSLGARRLDRENKATGGFVTFSRGSYLEAWTCPRLFGEMFCEVLTMGPVPTCASELTTQVMLEHAWRYFALHANQRMSLFNFFLVLAGLISAGLAACLQRTGSFQLLGVALGL